MTQAISGQMNGLSDSGNLHVLEILRRIHQLSDVTEHRNSSGILLPDRLSGTHTARMNHVNSVFELSDRMNILL